MLGIGIWWICSKQLDWSSRKGKGHVQINSIRLVIVSLCSSLAEILKFGIIFFYLCLGLNEAYICLKLNNIAQQNISSFSQETWPSELAFQPQNSSHSKLGDNPNIFPIMSNRKRLKCFKEVSEWQLCIMTSDQAGWLHAKITHSSVGEMCRAISMALHLSSLQCTFLWDSF